MLLPRVLTALVGIPLLVLVIYAGGWWLCGAVALLGVLALQEFFGLLEGVVARGVLPLRHASRAALLVSRTSGYLLAVAFPLLAAATSWSGLGASLGQLGLCVAGILAVILALGLWSGRGAPVYLALWLAGLGLPALFSYLVYLRLLQSEPLGGLRLDLPPGACWLFLVFAACWAADTVAYGVGRAWGRRRLWPAVSPGKTIEGSLGGLAAAAAVVGGFGALFGLETYFGIVLGVLLGIAGQAGDLAESKLKRLAGAKDSGSLLPGHGGVLDRFDSLLVNAPIAYYLLRAVLWG